MEWNDHWNLAGKHAILSPSNHAWQNYDIDKMSNVFLNKQKAEEGTRLHELASEMINLRIKPMNYKKAFYMFVNDAIAMRMSSEVLLYYSDNCFGTADAIKFYEKDNHLQIHDLKTGSNKVDKFHQLHAYAALFCLEYGYKPKELSIELRLYQGRDILIEQPEATTIDRVMKQIVTLDKVITETRNLYFNPQQ